MQPVHVLADQEAEEAPAFQLYQGHVGLRRPGALEGGVKLGGQATLLHGPHAVGASEDSEQREENKTHLPTHGRLLLTLKSVRAGDAGVPMVPSPALGFLQTLSGRGGQPGGQGLSGVGKAYG